VASKQGLCGRASHASIVDAPRVAKVETAEAVVPGGIGQPIPPKVGILFLSHVLQFETHVVVEPKDSLPTSLEVVKQSCDGKGVVPVHDVPYVLQHVVHVSPQLGQVAISDGKRLDSDGKRLEHTNFLPIKNQKINIPPIALIICPLIGLAD
jgi:hypothetical protein